MIKLSTYSMGWYRNQIIYTYRLIERGLCQFFIIYCQFFIIYIKKTKDIWGQLRTGGSTSTFPHNCHFLQISCPGGRWLLVKTKERSSVKRKVGARSRVKSGSGDATWSTVMDNRTSRPHNCNSSTWSTWSTWTSWSTWSSWSTLSTVMDNRTSQPHNCNIATSQLNLPSPFSSLTSRFCFYWRLSLSFFLLFFGLNSPLVLRHIL